MGTRRGVGARQRQSRDRPAASQNVYDADDQADFAIEHETPEPVELGNRPDFDERAGVENFETRSASTERHAAAKQTPEVHEDVD